MLATINCFTFQSIFQIPVHVTDFPVVNVHVDELSSARNWQYKLCVTLSANVNINTCICMLSNRLIYACHYKLFYLPVHLSNIRMDVSLLGMGWSDYYCAFPVVNVHVDELSSARNWQYKLCVTLSANVNINYRLPIKVYYNSSRRINVPHFFLFSISTSTRTKIEMGLNRLNSL
jgi:hypothetical protein